MTDARTRAVRRALLTCPTSLRELARQADVPHSTLAKIKRADLGASEAVAKAVAAVMERWAAELSDVAEGIKRSEGGDNA